MYDINSFFERLDWFYENHRLDHAENFMREQLKTAGEEAYKKALAQIKKCNGENESYRITAANLKKVQEKRNETCG